MEEYESMTPNRKAITNFSRPGTFRIPSSPKRRGKKRRRKKTKRRRRRRRGRKRRNGRKRRRRRRRKVLGEKYEFDTFFIVTEGIIRARH